MVRNDVGIAKNMKPRPKFGLAPTPRKTAGGTGREGTFSCRVSFSRLMLEEEGRGIRGTVTRR